MDVFMKLQVMSDLHLDFHRDRGRGFIEALDPTGVDVLVLAGDLAEVRCPEYGTMLRGLCAKYPHVVMVGGNHELYGVSPEKVDAMRKSLNDLIPNLHWLEDEVWVHPDSGHRFVGCVLWFREDIRAFWHREQLADFKLIRGFEPWVYDVNAGSRRFLASRVEAGDIVVTHHLPSQRSVDDRYRGSGLNAFFVCDMDDVMEATKPALWVHGHTHSPCDYMAGGTRVLCNPMGYPSERGTAFDSKLVVDVGTVAYVTYCRLRAEMLAVRAKNEDRDSEEEDALLDRMDPLWWKMTAGERALLNGSGAKEQAG